MAPQPSLPVSAITVPASSPPRKTAPKHPPHATTIRQARLHTSPRTPPPHRHAPPSRTATGLASRALARTIQTDARIAPQQQSALRQTLRGSSAECDAPPPPPASAACSCRLRMAPASAACSCRRRAAARASGGPPPPRASPLSCPASPVRAAHAHPRRSRSGYRGPPGSRPRGCPAPTHLDG